MPLTDDEKKTLEALQAKEKEPAGGTGPTLVIHVGNEGGMTVAEAVKRGFLDPADVEDDDEEDDDDKDGKKKGKKKPKDDDEPDPTPRRRGYFGDE